MSLYELISEFLVSSHPPLKRRRRKFLMLLFSSAVIVVSATTVASFWGAWESMIITLVAFTFFKLIGWPEIFTETIDAIFRDEQKIVVSEPDVQTVMNHLQNLGFKIDGWPESWQRKHFIDWLAPLLRQAEVGDCIAVAPGVWALIQPFASDLTDHTIDSTDLQALLCIRSCGTDIAHVTVLN